MPYVNYQIKQRFFLTDFSPSKLPPTTHKRLIINLLLVILSGLLDSNQRPRAPQTCALPTALNPDLCFKASAKISSLHVKNKFCQCFFGF